MQSTQRAIATLAAGLLGCVLAQAQALEPFKSYDNFSQGPLDPARWIDFEQTRQIRDDGFRLMQRVWPFTGADVGVLPINYTERFVNPGAISAIKAKITVKAIEVSSCPNNSAVGDSRARIQGFFFNVGDPIRGTNMNDMHVQVRVIRRSDSTDAPGVLRVEGIAQQCRDLSCQGTAPVGPTIDLGAVRTGKAVTVEMQWDKPNKRFLFSRDNGSFSGSVAYGSFINPFSIPPSPYDDSLPPGIDNKTLQTRVVLPNCQSGPRVSGMIDAVFDRVAVNNSYPTP